MQKYFLFLLAFPNDNMSTSESQPTDPGHDLTENLTLFNTRTQEDNNSDGSNNASTSTNPPSMIDGVQIPEGVDPSFLEALPEAIRREVLAEQLALRRNTSTTASSSGPSTSDGGENSSAFNVSPEFLAALPPEVQDEVSRKEYFLFWIINRHQSLLKS